MKPAKAVTLDPDLRCGDAIEFENNLLKNVIGQEDAIKKVTEVIGTYMAGLQAPNKPIANVLFLGPTGVGKTRLVEVVTEVLLDSDSSCIKINCAEFQQSHDIAKLTGSPPGYVGHKESIPFITQERLNKCHTKDVKLSVVLFDELEKAHQSFRELLLGVMDKGILRISSGIDVDFTSSIIFMTSNVGARSMRNLIKPMGFDTGKEDTKLDIKLCDVAVNAMRKDFSPEFINRLDKVIVFKSLKEEQIRQILRIEVDHIQRRILNSNNLRKFVIILDKQAEDYLLGLGISTEYGARELRRVLEKNIVVPISSMLLSSQINLGDVVRVSVRNGSLYFDKIPCEIIDKLPECLEIEA